MDENRTPTLRIHLTSDETINANLRRIDYCFAAKAASQPFPTRKLDPIWATPTIGLARSSNANLDHNWRLIDSLFSATPPPITSVNFHHTTSALLNDAFHRIIYAFILAAIPVPPDPEPPEEEETVDEELPADEFADEEVI
jgi:hypothetical protein